MRKVIIVEDDRFISTIFKMFLAELGHDLVGRCETGEKALELCHLLHPDVVLMDIHLQGNLDGIETAEKLKTQLDIPVIYISGDTSNAIIERAIVSNSYGYLVKPVNKKELGISIELAFYKHRVDVEQKKREKGYREFISESPVPIIIVRNDKIQYLNKLALDLMKTHYIEDIMWLDFLKFVGAESQKKVSELLSGDSWEDNRFSGEFVQMKDVHGDEFYAEISGCAVNFNDSASIQIIVRDVTNDYHKGQMLKLYQNALVNSKSKAIILDKNLEVIDLSNNGKEAFSEEIIDAVRKKLKALSLSDSLISGGDKNNGYDIEVSCIDSSVTKMKIYGYCRFDNSICRWIAVES